MSGIGEEKRETEFQNTMEALRRAESTLPDFTSSYDEEIKKLYEQIVTRPAFRYDPLRDPLYQGYRTQMVAEGERAMRDTMGKASALTGGYGSSYAQGVGQQQYDYYLQRLGQVMPELYKAAWEKWSAEGDDLYRQLDAALDLKQDEEGRARERYNQALAIEQQAYEREQDRLNRAAAQEQQAYQREQDRLNRADAREKLDYQREQDRLAQAAAREKLSYERGEKSYQKLVTLITQSGYMPTAAELAQAGMSAAQAQALRRNYLMNNPMAAISGGLPVSNLASVLAGAKSADPYGGVPIASAAARTGTSYSSGRSTPAYTGTSAGSAGAALSAGAAKASGMSKEQIKLAANRKGTNSKNKQRRL